MEWRQTIRETAGKAAHEAQKMAKIAKLNLHILSEEDKIKKAQLELGKLCHRDYVNNAEADASAYLPWHEKIESADTLIAALRAEIQRLKAEPATQTVEFVVVPTEPQADAESACRCEESPADPCGDTCCCSGGDCGCDTDCCCGNDEQNGTDW